MFTFNTLYFRHFIFQNWHNIRFLIYYSSMTYLWRIKAGFSNEGRYTFVYLEFLCSWGKSFYFFVRFVPLYYVNHFVCFLVWYLVCFLSYYKEKEYKLFNLIYILYYYTFKCFLTALPLPYIPTKIPNNTIIRDNLKTNGNGSIRVAKLELNILPPK